MKQSVFCLTCPHGAINIFRSVKGLEDGFEACLTRAVLRTMPDGEGYYCLSDTDMLRVPGGLTGSMATKRAHDDIAARDNEERTIMSESTEPPAEGFSKEEEERKREAYLLAHPALRWKIIQETITWAEANMPALLRRNRPRLPHQR